MSETEAEHTNKRARCEGDKDVTDAPSNGEYLLLTCVMYSFDGEFEQVYKPSLHASEDSLWQDFRSQLVRYLKVQLEMTEEDFDEHVKNMKDTEAWLREMDVEADRRVFFEIRKVSLWNGEIIVVNDDSDEDKDKV